MESLIYFCTALKIDVYSFSVSFSLSLFLSLSLSLIHFKEQEKFVKISSLREFQPAKLFVEFVNFNMIDYKVHFKNQLLGQLNF